MALKRKLQIVLDSVAPEIHNLWLRPIKDFKWELSFFNGSVWRPVVAAPTAHDHVVGDITNFPTSLPASDVSSWAKAETKPSYTFSEIGSHPTTLSGYGITDATPSSHIGSTGNSHGVATSEVNGFMSTEDKIKLTNIAENANNYLHPDSHPATIITQTSDYRFVTDTEKGVWNGKEDVSNKKTDLTANSDTYYPSQKAVKTAIDAKVDKTSIVNNLTTTTEGSVLDARQGKVLNPFQ